VTARIPVQAALTESLPVTQSSGAVQTKQRQSTAIWLGSLVAVVVVVLGAMLVLLKIFTPTASDQVAVPDLQGLTVAQATTLLKNTGLLLGDQLPQASTERPKDTIISQSPGRDIMVSKGSTVDIVISTGPGQVAVPQLADLISPDDARVALGKVGLTLGTVTQENADAAAGTVLRSDPEAGTMVDPGTSVSIWISSGLIKIPNVVGYPATQAQAELANAGFNVETVPQVDTSVAEGTVLSQDPVGGGTAEQGATITLTVSTLA
jgi:serine/threonine-protein kinase